MAAGIPIVSTSIPEAVRLSAVIEIAYGAETLVSGVERGITRKNRIKEEGIALSRRQSWQRRADKVINLISERMEAGR